MKVALVYPPSCDPTAPYLSVPTLTAWLRKHGVEVLPVDANLEGWEYLLCPDRLCALAARLEQRLAALEEQPSLSHAEQLVYGALWRARGDAAAVPSVIEAAIATLRDRSGNGFYDRSAYEAAVATVEAALRVVSAAYAPLSVDLVTYRTPFSLLTAEDIARDASAERDPFHAYFATLVERLRGEGVGLVGISVAFPGQIQPAFSLAYAIRAHLPEVHVTVGGPAITQIFLRLSGEDLDRAMGPFHTAVVFEGELSLLEMVATLDRGENPAASGRLIRGRTVEDLGSLPPPDFSGLPLDRYLSPELVLPYDPTRGCYWGVCTFCHYGLAEVGTARYRERPIETVLDHLEELSKKHTTSVFYLSQDVFSPRIATALARGLRARGLPLHWGTDMRPERSLSPERCEELRAGGALSCSLGVESASPRVLSLIDKGIPTNDVRQVIQNLSRAGIAVEAMCFSDFPTETFREAMETIRFVRGVAPDLALFILGRFDLTYGSIIAQRPADFGIADVWQVRGDELKTGLFFTEKSAPKRPDQQEKLDQAVSDLSTRFRMHRYPWAGALSTAHSMLYYRRFGKDAFHGSDPLAPHAVPGARAQVATARFDVCTVIATAAENEAAIWGALVHERREVGAKAYEAEAALVPHAFPSAGRFRFAAGCDPEPVGRAPARRGRVKVGGRRPSHAVNGTKP